MSENKVKFGLSNVYVAKITQEGDTVTYGTPFRLPGAVNLSINPDGEVTPFYADNVKYYIAIANSGYSGDLEIAITPKQFLKDILGQKEDSHGALVESADDVISSFALMGEMDGDVKKRRFVYYNCTVERPSSSLATTQDSKEPQTDTLSISIAARSADKVVKAILEPSETNKTQYDAFFTSVYEPAIV